ncbi:His Kinase A (phospho-acceptor) domain-containing protein [Hydrobacter penzbergensis]|jgi:two-component system, OmpR family, sensor histidine kinase CiaH|uniref:histidine kinase n=2 Tax=Pseudomonadati TaxID=3379134 RepID=A0A8X8IHG2_9BACT|nr:ATP-binding protein [Hydrobacter penzbergensis]SDX44996.1 His Kinase A (phospho-acceptor) domain-containing protein [Hydrobacter penzbergensis]
MSFFRSKKLAIVTIVYWFLLLYMIAALSWWFIALEKQNKEVSTIRLQELKKDDPAYFVKAVQIEEAKNRKTSQYIGEGMTFLALVVLGAVFVFRTTRKQIRFVQQQQNFMMAVTHELKTPIAVTRLNLETLQRRKLDEEKQQQLISNSLQETNRLNALCNNMLLAAQLESGVDFTTQPELNFTDLVEGCIDDFKNRFPNREIKEEIEEGVYLKGEDLLLQMLVNNLVENAMKYSPPASAIIVKLVASDDEVLLAVTDEGSGIPDTERKKIFDKFYRIGNENTRSAKGTGLGLYLCAKIAERHNGSISVVHNQPQGSIFTVLFQT